MNQIISCPFSKSTRTTIKRTIVKNAGTIVFPTETFYALGCSASSEQAVRKIYDLKARRTTQPLLILISDWVMFHRYVKSVSGAQLKLIEQYWPGPLTVVLEVKRKLAKQLNFQDHKVAIRMTSNPVACEIIKLCGIPIVGTSANLSNHPAVVGVKEAYTTFQNRVDLYIDGGPSPGGPPSTIIRFDNHGNLKIVRQGALGISCKPGLSA